MKSVVMVLTGPLQAWGTVAGFSAQRPTDPMPSLSGIVGMIANALGRERSDPIGDLCNADLLVRADRPGHRVRDFHTVGTFGRYVPKAGGGKGKNPIVSERWYLADAAFMVVYSPKAVDVSRVAYALQQPARPLYLGRRSCPPTGPIVIGLSEVDPESLARSLPVLSRPAEGSTLLVTIERSEQAGSHQRMDVPIDFDSAHRRHQSRQVGRLQTHCTAAGLGIKGIRKMTAALEQIGSA